MSRKGIVVWVLDKVGEGELYPHTHTKCERGSLVPTVTPPWMSSGGQGKVA